MYYELDTGRLSSLDSSLVATSLAVALNSQKVVVGDSQGRIHSLDNMFAVQETVQVCPEGDSVNALEMYSSEASTEKDQNFK
jgi:hypothetical protein